MRIGVIGTGAIGEMIVGALLRSKSVRPKNLSVFNRTESKARVLARKYPGLAVCHAAENVVRRSDVVFLCVRPAQFPPLLQNLQSTWQPEKLAISVTSPIRIDQLETVIPCHVARVVPSLVNQSLSGSTLVTFGTTLSDFQKFKLWNLLGNFSQPLEIDEEKIRAASDLASCGPAFLSFWLERMIAGATRSTALNTKEATELVTQMVIGFAKLLDEKTYTLSELREKVTVRGGVTGRGLAILQQEDANLFTRLFAETQKKFREDHQALDGFFDKGE
ncbi:MAG: late competence protein ComER [Sporolactobacillus sp.]|jgi:competence protein ComER|nr:late competence protein ComER [Sporolactobacillus sp.]